MAYLTTAFQTLLTMALAALPVMVLSAAGLIACRILEKRGKLRDKK